MDWTTFFENNSQSLFTLGGVCLGSLTSFIIFIVGYFVQKKYDERKRKWELEDRKTGRHIAITDMRIREARDYLDTYISIIDKITNLEGALMGELAGDALSSLLINPEHIEDKARNYQQIVKSVNDTKGKRMSFLILNNMELNEQLNGFLSLVADELVNMGEGISKASKNGFFEDKTEYLKKVLFFNERATAYIQVMQTRLDELAKTM